MEGTAMAGVVWCYLKSFIHPVILVRRRLMALLLCLPIVFGAVAPTASAISVTMQQHASNLPKSPHDAKPVDTGTPLSTHYAGILPAGESNIKPAGDVGKDVFDRSQTTPLVSGALNGPGTKQKSKRQELPRKRTATTETFDLGNGKTEVRSYMHRVHYKVDGEWQKIDDSLVEDANAAKRCRL